MSTKTIFDFVVIGGGGGGCAAARTIHASGGSVAVCDGGKELGGFVYFARMYAF